MAYSPPEGNITSGVEVFSWINTTVDNWFFPGIIIGLFFIIVIKLLFSDNGAGKSLTAGAFICMVLSVLLRTMNLVNTPFMITFIILTAVGVVWNHIENTGRIV